MSFTYGPNPHWNINCKLFQNTVSDSTTHTFIYVFLTEGTLLAERTTRSVSQCKLPFPSANQRTTILRISDRRSEQSSTARLLLSKAVGSTQPLSKKLFRFAKAFFYTIQTCNLVRQFIKQQVRFINSSNSKQGSSIHQFIKQHSKQSSSIHQFIKQHTFNIHQFINFSLQKFINSSIHQIAQ